MWTLGKEKEVQLELAVLGSNIDLRTYIEFAYPKLVEEPREGISSLDKLYELLVTALTYGESEKELQFECPHCKQVVNPTINIPDYIQYIPGSELPDPKLPINEFLSGEGKDGLQIRIEINCMFCRKPILLVVGPEDIFKKYLFSYDIIQFYQLVYFFKKAGYSINEIENMTYIEVKILKNIISEQREKEDAERKQRHQQHQDFLL